MTAILLRTGNVVLKMSQDHEYHSHNDNSCTPDREILHFTPCEKDKSVPRVTIWHHEASLVMPKCDPRDRFVYPYLTLM